MQLEEKPVMPPEAYTFLENLYESVIYVPQPGGLGIVDGQAELKGPGYPGSLDAASFQFVDAMLEAAVLWGSLAEKQPVLREFDNHTAKKYCAKIAKAFAEKYEAECGTEDGKWAEEYNAYYQEMDKFISRKLAFYTAGVIQILDGGQEPASEDAGVLADVARMIAGLIGAGDRRA